MKYEIGMYGGKFMPLHKGHIYCIETAVSECNKVYVILFYGGSDEQKILALDNSNYLSVRKRKRKLIEITQKYANAIPIFIDVSKCRNIDGSENWDNETPLVRNVVGPKLDAVYSSEESYDDYFHRAYPEAVHRLVDVERIKYPISGTKLRKMKTKEERKKWMV